MKKIIKKISVIIFLFLTHNLFAQEPKFGSKTETHKLFSQDGDEYIINVTFPKDYNDKKEYKTLYYLDAFWLSDIILGSFTILNLSNYVEDVVLIGITLNGNEKDWHKQRDMDFTPSPFKNLGILEDFRTSNPQNIKISAKTGGENLLNEQNTGDADLFMDFLENDVIKFVETKYPNLTKRRGLLGHSFGGLFGFYTLQNHSDLFQDFILISASLSWNSFELVEKSKFSKLGQTKNEINLYHSYGENEIAATKKSNRDINNIIVNSEIKNLNYEFEPFEDANHHSILSRAIYDGLWYIYKK